MKEEGGGKGSQVGAGDEEGWAPGRNKAVKETELALQSLFLHLRSGEDPGVRRGQLGSGRLSGVTGHCSKHQAVSNLKGQRDGCHRFRPHGRMEFTAPAGQVLPTQTNQAQPRVCDCTQPRIQGRSPGTGRVQHNAPISQQLSACTATAMGSTRMPPGRQHLPCVRRLCLNLPFAQACSWGEGGRRLPDP